MSFPRHSIPITLLAVANSAAASASDPAGLAFFESRIRPALVAHCQECHAGETAEAGLRLDFRGGWQKGGKSGPALVPGNPGQSLLMRAIRHEPNSPKMPKDRLQLSYDLIVDLAEWIRIGAPDPRATPPSADESIDRAWQAKLAERGKWWSLQPMSSSQPPKIPGATNPVDRFVQARLRKAGLSPAPAANPNVLLRRLAFILTGLPPEPPTTAAFAKAWSQNPAQSVANFTDHLLDSPHFGERFARHWMDVVRYTDTYGYEWDNPAKGAWRYRDYLIRAFNQDVGFDQLVREQLAGDLVPTPRINETEGLNESLIGPMFYHFGEHRHGDSLNFNGIHQEMLNNKIDAFSKAFLATTVACARCHNHKLEAVSQKDYYALASVLMSARWTSRVVDTPARNAPALRRLRNLRTDIRGELARLWTRTAHDFEGNLTSATLLPKDSPMAPGSVAYPIGKVINAPDTDIAQQWTSLSNAWQTAHDQAVTENTKQFVFPEDFADPLPPPGWTTEGDGMHHAFVRSGEPLIALTGESAVTQLLPTGFHTHALSSKLPGSLRTPDLPQTGHTYLSLRLAGGEWAGHLTIPDNAFQSERVKFLNHTNPIWIRFSCFPQNTNENIRTEIATADLNPNFPPRTGLARIGKLRLPDRDDGTQKRSWFSVTGIVAHDKPGAPKATLGEFAGLYGPPVPTTKAEAYQRIARWLTKAVQHWATGRGDDEELAVVNWLLTIGALPNRADASPKLARLVAEYRAVEGTVSFPATVNGMDERAMAPVSYRLNLRGNVNEVGDPVLRDFLKVFAGRNRVAQSSGSGRLELADFLIEANHPLTARVYVNRVWQWIFGTGLVATPDDFGRLGERPSHPELLDYLATEFVRQGWSTKSLIRRIVKSRTFQQSGTVSAAGRELDPDNRLLHHYPTRRLEAEAIRDALLAVSGRLDPTLYGPPIDPPRVREHPPKRLFSGPADGAGRRSLYWKVTMMELPAFLTGFNFPDPKLPNGKRDVTNVPAQALLMMNNPFVTAAAGHWAKRLLAEPDQTAALRLGRMFRQTFGREATAGELKRWSRAAKSFATQSDLLADEAAWSEVAHALFNSKEFIYYR